MVGRGGGDKYRPWLGQVKYLNRIQVVKRPFGVKKKKERKLIILSGRKRKKDPRDVVANTASSVSRAHSWVLMALAQCSVLL